jgi:DNA invertase Pin-like site-specific DNA recombinase
VGFKVLTGHGASIDTTTAAGKMVFGIFAALSEFERELISERTRAGLASARARGHKGGRAGSGGASPYPNRGFPRCFRNGRHELA